jgi:prevent-host-death family protein
LKNIPLPLLHFSIKLSQGTKFISVEDKDMRTVNVHEAKTHLSRLIALVVAGEEIIIAKGGQPCARLVPLSQVEKKRKPGIAQGAVTDAFFESLPEEELLAWEK